MWIKFVKDCTSAGRKLGDRWEVQDEAIARAYIAAGYATEDKTAETDLLAGLRTTVETAVGELRTAISSEVAEIGQTVARGFSNGAKRFQPRVDATESEDEKLVRTGSFKSIGHFALTLSRDGGPAPGLVRGDSILGRYNSAAGEDQPGAGRQLPGRHVREQRARRRRPGPAGFHDPDLGAALQPRRSSWPAPRATRSAATRSPCRRTRKRAVSTATGGVACSATGRAKPSSSPAPGRNSAT